MTAFSMLTATGCEGDSAKRYDVEIIIADVLIDRKSQNRQYLNFDIAVCTHQLRLKMRTFDAHALSIIETFLQDIIVIATVLQDRTALATLLQAIIILATLLLDITVLATLLQEIIVKEQLLHDIKCYSTNIWLH